MSRKGDLERGIRESYDIIRQYEAQIRTSDRPEEKARARRLIKEQWALIAGYLDDYRPLCDGSLPDDLAQIAATVPGARGTAAAAAPAGQEVPTAGPKYTVHIDRADGIAIGDGARVVRTDVGARRAGADGSPGLPSTATVRALLNEALTDQELDALCFDHFRPVYDGFSSGMGKGQKVQYLIEHCVRHDELPRLLDLLHRINPTQYDRFLGER
jgi:hypothetical protein